MFFFGKYFFFQEFFDNIYFLVFLQKSNLCCRIIYNVDDTYATNIWLVSWLSCFQEKIYIKCITSLAARSFIKMIFATNAWRIVRRCDEPVITSHCHNIIYITWNFVPFTTWIISHYYILFNISIASIPLH